MSTDFSLKGKVALVTGAGTGLGQGIAIGLAQAGAARARQRIATFGIDAASCATGTFTTIFPGQLQATGQSCAAYDPVLDQVATAFETVVPGMRATAEDNLHSLGGDSLQAVDVALELETRLGVPVPPEVMERMMSIGDLAKWIAARRPRSASARA